MTTIVEVNNPNPSYAHPLVSWGSVIFGTVVAVAVGILLNILVVVFDATSAANQMGANPNPIMAGLGTAIWGAIANFLALFAGGFIAARAANHPDHHDGMLHGVAVWALALLVAAVLLGSAAAKLTGSALEDMSASAPPAATQTMPPAPTEPPTAKALAAEQASTLDEERAMAKTTARTAFWAFAGILIGLVAAILGGILGARHPHHWHARPRHTLMAPPAP